jgi:hypothetical protein
LMVIAGAGGSVEMLTTTAASTEARHPVDVAVQNTTFLPQVKRWLSRFMPSIPRFHKTF